MSRTDATAAMPNRAARIAQLKRQNKTIAEALGLISAAWAITLYIGVNYISNDEDDSLAFKLTKTISSVFINFCIVHIMGKGVMELGLNKLRIKEQRETISAQDVLECTAVTTGSVTASFIYADLAPTMKSAVFNNAAGYALYLAANTPFHYNGTKTFLHHFKQSSLSLVADWFIASNLFAEFFVRQKLDAQIRNRINQAFNQALLAHDLAQQTNAGLALPQLTGTPLNKAASIIDGIDIRRYINKQTQHWLTRNTASVLLLSCILTAIGPFLFDSYSTQPLGFAKFVSTVVANIGLATMMTKDYTQVIADTLTYQNPPQLVRKHSDNRHIQRRLVAAAIVATTSTITAFTVFTTLSLFNKHMANVFKTSGSKITAEVAIWIGTLAFNIYAVNSLCFNAAAQHYFSNDRLHQFSEAAKNLKTPLAQAVSKDPVQLEQSMGSQLLPLQRTYLSNARDLSNEQGSLVMDAMRKQARAFVVQKLAICLTPLLLSIATDQCLQHFSATKIAPPLRLTMLLTPFFIASIALHLCSKRLVQPKPSNEASAELIDPLLQADAAEQGTIDTDTIENDATAISRSSCLQAVTSLLSMSKGVLFGIACHCTLRLMNQYVKLGLSQSGLAIADTAVTLGASCLMNS